MEILSTLPVQLQYLVLSPLLSNKKSNLDFCLDLFHSSRGSQKRHTHVISVASLGRVSFRYMLQKFSSGKQGKKRN